MLQSELDSPSKILITTQRDNRVNGFIMFHLWIYHHERCRKQGANYKRYPKHFPIKTTVHNFRKTPVKDEEQQFYRMNMDDVQRLNLGHSNTAIQQYRFSSPNAAKAPQLVQWGRRFPEALGLALRVLASLPSFLPLSEPFMNTGRLTITHSFSKSTWKTNSMSCQVHFWLWLPMMHYETYWYVGTIWIIIIIRLLVSSLWVAKSLLCASKQRHSVVQRSPVWTRSLAATHPERVSSAESWGCQFSQNLWIKHVGHGPLVSYSAYNKITKTSLQMCTANPLHTTGLVWNNSNKWFRQTSVLGCFRPGTKQVEAGWVQTTSKKNVRTHSNHPLEHKSLE